MKKSMLAAVLITFGAVAAVQAETTITFDPRPAGSRVDINGYSEGGMVFADALNPGSVIAADTGGVPSNGTAFLSTCGTCRPSMQASDGGLFDLLALDVGEHLFFGSGPFPLSVRVTGTHDDGTTTVASLRTDGAVGFQTILLDDSFRDLVRVEFTNGSIFAGAAFDDLVVAVGAAKPELLVSPPSGTYMTTQSFDLTLITRGDDGAQLLQATLDGEDFTADLAACGITGSLAAEAGTTIRCALGAEELGEGQHEFKATVELQDGSTASTDASWEVLGSMEP